MSYIKGWTKYKNFLVSNHFYGEFHADQESEIGFALSWIISSLLVILCFLFFFCIFSQFIKFFGHVVIKFLVSSMDQLIYPIWRHLYNFFHLRIILPLLARIWVFPPYYHKTRMIVIGGHSASIRELCRCDPNLPRLLLS